MARLRCFGCGEETLGRQVRCPPCGLACVTVSRVAHMRLKAAISAGKIPPAKKFACVDCSKPALDYDHRDYTQPFAVQPVCRSCNLKRGPAIWRTGQQPANVA